MVLQKAMEQVGAVIYVGLVYTVHVVNPELFIINVLYVISIIISLQNISFANHKNFFKEHLVQIQSC